MFGLSLYYIILLSLYLKCTYLQNGGSNLIPIHSNPNIITHMEVKSNDNKIVDTESKNSDYEYQNSAFYDFYDDENSEESDSIAEDYENEEEIPEPSDLPYNYYQKELNINKKDIENKQKDIANILGTRFVSSVNDDDDIKKEFPNAILKDLETKEKFNHNLNSEETMKLKNNFKKYNVRLPSIRNDADVNN